MSGDNTNIQIISTCDVFIAPLGSALPATLGAAFPAAWLQCGLIADDNIETARDWGIDEDFYSIEGVLIAQIKGQYKEGLKFAFLEDNAATRSIIWPGSTDTALMTPVPVPVLFAVDITFQNGGRERIITKNYAKIPVEGWTRGLELSKFAAEATIFADSAGQLWVRQSSTPTAVPVIASALPSGAAAGAQVTISGSHFTGTTGATIGGVAITQRTIVNDSTLVVVVPTGSAGSAPIIVTNATGASASFAYTRA